jgi:glycosyltransferase involved in cell wall biosynthesis
MKLTIAIPTYNRNEILTKNIEKLLPQVTNECRVIIVDNCSDIPVEDTIKDLLEEYSHIDISVIRNRYNIGMTANILKCFGECPDPWLWVLGDDDEVTDGAVARILSDIDRKRELHLITYAWDADSFKREQEVITTGIDQFLETFETFGVVLFLSTSVYNMNKVVGSMSFAHFFQTSYAPHLVMLFMSLGDEGKCAFSRDQIVVNKAEETPSELKWDQIFIYQLTLLLRLPLKPSTIAKLRNRLEQLTRVWTIYHFIFTLTFTEYEEGSINKPTILYGEVVRSFFHLDRRISTRLVSRLGYFIVKYPFLFKWILARMFKAIKGEQFEPDKNLRI